MNHKTAILHSFFSSNSCASVQFGHGHWQCIVCPITLPERTGLLQWLSVGWSGQEGTADGWRSADRSPGPAVGTTSPDRRVGVLSQQHRPRQSPLHPLTDGLASCLGNKRVRWLAARHIAHRTGPFIASQNWRSALGHRPYRGIGYIVHWKPAQSRW